MYTANHARELCEARESRHDSSSEPSLEWPEVKLVNDFKAVSDKSAKVVTVGLHAVQIRIAS